MITLPGTLLWGSSSAKTFTWGLVWFGLVYGLWWSVVDFALLRMEPMLPRQVITRLPCTPRQLTVEVRASHGPQQAGQLGQADAVLFVHRILHLGENKKGGLA